MPGVAPAPPGSETPTVTVPLPSNPYGGFSAPAVTQPFVNGLLQEKGTVKFAKEEGGAIKFDREAAANISVDDQAHLGRAQLAKSIIEQEMAGYYNVVQANDLEDDPAGATLQKCFVLR